jgi:hypothetical protein
MTVAKSPFHSLTLPTDGFEGKMGEEAAQAG